MYYLIVVYHGGLLSLPSCNVELLEDWIFTISSELVCAHSKGLKNEKAEISFSMHLYLCNHSRSSVFTVK